MSKSDTAPKRYLLTNDQPGPRGVQTADAGIVMVQPGLPGAEASNGVIATLTDDELEMAENAGLKAVEQQGAEVTSAQTENLPAEGQIDRNAPDASKALKPGKANFAGAEKIQAENAKLTAQGQPPKLAGASTTSPAMPKPAASKPAAGGGDKDSANSKPNAGNDKPADPEVGA
jgi:hypothetical protein